MSPHARNITVAVIICLVVVLSFVLFRRGNSKEDYYSAISPQPLSSQKTQVTTDLQNNENFTHMINIETNYGDITFSTYDEDAPLAVKNFTDLAEKGYYDNVIFHRVISGFMIQGGDPTGTGRGGPGYKFSDELNPNSESYKNGYKKGVVAMANSGPNTNGSQFFIMLEDNPLPNQYTIFGKVVKGQEVVDSIGQVKTDQDDKPLSPVVIKKVTVTRSEN